MKDVIDLDTLIKEKVAIVPFSEKVRGITPRQIFEEWEKAKIFFGNPPLGDPLIINNPDHPVHFGITLKWQVVLNLASVPTDLEGDAMLHWIKSFPIMHEMAHYQFCPYDAVTHAYMSLKVMERWKTALEDEVLYILNFFSDIVVNNELYKILGEDFFNGMKKWIEFTVFNTIKKGYKMSLMYLIFILCHELLWNRRFVAFNYPPEINKVAGKIVDIMLLSKDRIDAVGNVTVILKQIIIDENNGRSSGKGVEILTNLMMEKVKKMMKGNPIPRPRSEENKKDEKGVPIVGSSDNPRNGEGNDSPDDLLVRVKKGKKNVTRPFDITFFMGDPSAEKTRGNVNKTEKEVEERRILSIIRRMDLPFNSSFKIMNSMKIATTVDHAWRLWMRSRAKGMINYDTRTVQKNRGGSYVPSEWNWEQPFSEWNVMGSMTNFPPFPFPPFSRGYKHFKGFRGSATLPEVRDLLIARDSSGSMQQMMQGTKQERWTKMVGIQHKVNNKFNLSSLACFASLHSAVQKGARFAVVNFSSDYTATDWMEPNEKTISIAERTILKFKRGATRLPVEKIKELVDQRSKCFVLIITDGYLHNWESFLKTVDSFKKKDHEICFIFITNKGEKSVKMMGKKLKERRISIHYVTDPNDLFRTTLKEVERAYA